MHDQGLDNYYTMSSKGCTHFWEAQADFSGLEQFERDYFLYTQLMRLRMFRQFRLWKAFKVRHISGTRALMDSYLYLVERQQNA
jgi:dynein heavy chain